VEIGPCKLHKTGHGTHRAQPKSGKRLLRRLRGILGYPKRDGQDKGPITRRIVGAGKGGGCLPTLVRRAGIIFKIIGVLTNISKGAIIINAMTKRSQKTDNQSDKPRLTIEIDQALKNRFLEKVGADGRTMRWYLEKWIREFVGK